LYLIGLTGNIATGKSAVGRMLTELGARVIDADAIAHLVTAKGQPAWLSIGAEFGEGILRPDGEVDRPKLGALVFADPAALRRLEAIVHPAVLERIAELLAQATAPVVVLDAIKLMESGFADLCDAVWVVTCSPEQQLARLMHTRQMSEAEARLRIEAQPPQAEKIARADVVIDNSGRLAQTRRQVAQAWARIPLNPPTPAPRPQSAGTARPRSTACTG
jgi:dephospho-CoA kinase